MGSILRRAGSKLLELIAEATDPAALASHIVNYSKLVSGSAEWFVRESGGVMDQMTGPGAVLPVEYIRGLGISWVSASRVQVAPGQCRGRLDTDSITLGVATTADITVSGVNGLDAGAEAANTFYCVWVIGDSTRVNPAATLLSTSFTAPTLPAGYNLSRRVGAVKNNAGSNFMRFFQRGNDHSRRIWYDEARADLQVVTNYTGSIADLTVNGNVLAPPFARVMVLGCEFFAPLAGALATNVLGIGITGSSTGRLQQTLGILSAVSWRWNTEWYGTLTQTFTTRATDADNVINLFILAYDDEL